MGVNVENGPHITANSQSRTANSEFGRGSSELKTGNLPRNKILFQSCTQRTDNKLDLSYLR